MNFIDPGSAKAQRLSAADAELSQHFPASEWDAICAYRSRGRFPQALIRYDELLSVGFLDNPVLTMSMRETSRFNTLAIALHLHDVRNADDPRSGLTMGLLKSVCEKFGIASAGRVAEIINLLIHNRYFARTPCTVDKRITLIAPTERMVPVLYRWDKAYFEMLDVSNSQLNLTADFIADPTLGPRLRRAVGNKRVAGWSSLSAFPDVNMFLERAGGWSLFARCMSMWMNRAPEALDAPLTLNLEEFAAEAGASRSSLRRLLTEAHQQGLLLTAPRTGQNIVMSDKLVSTGATWLAYLLLTHETLALALDKPMPQ
jgi:AraC-like DNA-binding protein